MNTALHHAPDVRSMRRTSAILLALAALLALGALLLWLLRQPVFDIRRIVIEGEVEHTTPTQLRRQLAGIAQAGWFTLDLQQARAAFEQLPWVRRAQVRRAFPQHLRVTLHEHQPAAWWRGEGELVSQQGEVFEATFARQWRGAQDGAEGHLAGALARLPQLSGPEGSAAQVLDMYRHLTPALAPLGLELRALRLNARAAWQAQLDNGARLELGTGSGQAVMQRVQRFVRTARALLAAQEEGPQHAAARLQGADLRYADGYALRLHAAAPQP